MALQSSGSQDWGHAPPLSAFGIMDMDEERFGDPVIRYLFQLRLAASRTRSGSSLLHCLETMCMIAVAILAAPAGDIIQFSDNSVGSQVFIVLNCVFLTAVYACAGYSFHMYFVKQDHTPNSTTNRILVYSLSALHAIWPLVAWHLAVVSSVGSFSGWIIALWIWTVPAMVLLLPVFSLFVYNGSFVTPSWNTLSSNFITLHFVCYVCTTLTLVVFLTLSLSMDNSWVIAAPMFATGVAVVTSDAVFAPFRIPVAGLVHALGWIAFLAMPVPFLFFLNPPRWSGVLVFVVVATVLEVLLYYRTRRLANPRIVEQLCLIISEHVDLIIKTGNREDGIVELSSPVTPGTGQTHLMTSAPQQIQQQQQQQQQQLQQQQQQSMGAGPGIADEGAVMLSEVSPQLRLNQVLNDLDAVYSPVTFVRDCSSSWDVVPRANAYLQTVLSQVGVSELAIRYFAGLLEGAMAAFPHAPFLKLAYATLLIELGSVYGIPSAVQSGTRRIRHLQFSWIVDRFAHFCALMAWQMAPRVPRTPGAFEERLSIRKGLEVVDLLRVRCLELIAEFWKQMLSSSVNEAVLLQILAELDKLSSRGAANLRRLHNAFPRCAEIIRAKACFAEQVEGDAETASDLYRQAERVEDEESKMWSSRLGFQETISELAMSDPSFLGRDGGGSGGGGGGSASASNRPPTPSGGGPARKSFSMRRSTSGTFPLSSSSPPPPLYASVRRPSHLQSHQQQQQQQQQPRGDPAATTTTLAAGAATANATAAAVASVAVPRSSSPVGQSGPSKRVVRLNSTAGLTEDERRSESSSDAQTTSSTTRLARLQHNVQMFRSRPLSRMRWSVYLTAALCLSFFVAMFALGMVFCQQPLGPLSPTDQSSTTSVFFLIEGLERARSRIGMLALPSFEFIAPGMEPMFNATPAMEGRLLNAFDNGLIRFTLHYSKLSRVSLSPEVEGVLAQLYMMAVFGGGQQAYTLVATPGSVVLGNFLTESDTVYSCLESNLTNAATSSALSYCQDAMRAVSVNGEFIVGVVLADLASAEAENVSRYPRNLMITIIVLSVLALVSTLGVIALVVWPAMKHVQSERSDILRILSSLDLFVVRQLRDDALSCAKGAFDDSANACDGVGEAHTPAPAVRRRSSRVRGDRRHSSGSAASGIEFLLRRKSNRSWDTTRRATMGILIGLGCVCAYMAGFVVPIGVFIHQLQEILSFVQSYSLVEYYANNGAIATAGMSNAAYMNDSLSFSGNRTLLQNSVSGLQSIFNSIVFSGYGSLPALQQISGSVQSSLTTPSCSNSFDTGCLSYIAFVQKTLSDLSEFLTLPMNSPYVISNSTTFQTIQTDVVLVLGPKAAAVYNAVVQYFADNTDMYRRVLITFFVCAFVVIPLLGVCEISPSLSLVGNENKQLRHMFSRLPIDVIDRYPAILNFMNGMKARDVIAQLEGVNPGLDETNHQLEFILEHAPEGFVQLDSEGNVTKVNLSFKRLVGLQEHEILGLPIQSHFAEAGDVAEAVVEGIKFTQVSSDYVPSAGGGSSSSVVGGGNSGSGNGGSNSSSGNSNSNSNSSRSNSAGGAGAGAAGSVNGNHARKRGSGGPGTGHHYGASAAIHGSGKYVAHDYAGDGSQTLVSGSSSGSALRRLSGDVGHLPSETASVGLPSGSRLSRRNVKLKMKDGRTIPVEFVLTASVLNKNKGGSLLLFAFIRDTSSQERHRELLEAEKKVSNDLLHSILPESVVRRIHKKEWPIVDVFDTLCVCFGDIVGFTAWSAALGPKETVAQLDRLYTEFDRIADQHHIQRIKLIGDSYMCCSGLDSQDSHRAYRNSVEDMVHGCLCMIEFASMLGVRFRFGMHYGPVCAGVIGGQKRMTYDLFGDTVNVASRMESTSEPGVLSLSREAYFEVFDLFDFEEVKVQAKGKGQMLAYRMRGPKRPSVDAAAVNYVRRSSRPFLNFSETRSQLISRLTVDPPPPDVPGAATSTAEDDGSEGNPAAGEEPVPTIASSKSADKTAVGQGSEGGQTRPDTLTSPMAAGAAAAAARPPPSPSMASKVLATARQGSRTPGLSDDAPDPAMSASRLNEGSASGSGGRASPSTPPRHPASRRRVSVVNFDRSSGGDDGNDDHRSPEPPQGDPGGFQSIAASDPYAHTVTRDSHSPQ